VLEETRFVENGNTFHANVISGQKSGFFLDQRDNRRRLGDLCGGKTVLNLFGYTGGFSVYAGKAGASEVATVDIAKPAVEAAEKNWALNGLPQEKHKAIAANVFPYLEEARVRGEKWDVAIVDPPSFAASKSVLDKAVASYTSLIAASVQVIKGNGLLAASSCSSHITPELFLDICEESIAKARRKGVVLGIYGQPEDHPFPLACKELQYLKFVIIRVE
jgi:23S rRNA (cytosine1962-C5)-methyltransferase